MLTGKKILLGVTGSIAAYKAATLVRLLVKQGADVKVVMTPAATGFIAPLSLSTLSRNEVLHELSENDTWSNHVMLGRWADLMIMAPLTCNTLSKMAHGACDNMLMAVYLSATCPVAFAPAMDEDMWKHPATKKNLATLASFNNHLIPVAFGELASGLIGEGRMAEPEAIVAWVDDFFNHSRALAGKQVLITAGPTYEAIDPVRFIGNHSSGKMGIALAEACRNMGAEVTLVYGPVSQPLPMGTRNIPVTTAADMYDATLDAFSNCDICIMCAAVADFTPVSPAGHKIKKETGTDTLELQLVKTKDILKALGQRKTDKQVLVGFALETNDGAAYASEKLSAKNADMIVLNSLADPGAGFGHDSNKITIFERGGKITAFEMSSKKTAAEHIINQILAYTHA
jgi:phosphopantothenoylcysteine decarboxylase/phosphopantothenate--cysteine ligase